MNIATYDLPDLYRGDTLDPVYLKLKFKNPPLVPLNPSTPPDVTVDPDDTTPETPDVTVDPDDTTPETPEDTVDPDDTTPETPEDTVDPDDTTPETPEDTVDPDDTTPETPEDTVDPDDTTPETPEDTVDPPPDATVDPDGTIHPAKVCCQLRDRAGRLLHTFNTQIHEDGTVELEGVASTITAFWEPGVYLYDVEFTLPKGRVRTYLKGQIKILGDVSSCQTP